MRCDAVPCGAAQERRGGAVRVEANWASGRDGGVRGARGRELLGALRCGAAAASPRSSTSAKIAAKS